MPKNEEKRTDERYRLISRYSTGELQKRIHMDAWPGYTHYEVFDLWGVPASDRYPASAYHGTPTQAGLRTELVRSASAPVQLSIDPALSAASVAAALRHLADWVESADVIESLQPAPKANIIPWDDLPPGFWE